MDGEGEDDSTAEDISLLMGAAGVSHAIDEETEALFIEDMETFSIEEEKDSDLILGDDDYGDMPEEKERPRYHNPLDDPLDDLVEPTEAGGAESPMGGSPPETPAEPANRSEPPAPQMPPLPNYPQYPSPPPYAPNRSGPPPAAKPEVPPPPELPAEEELDMSVGEEIPPEEEISPEEEIFPEEEIPAELELLDSGESTDSEDIILGEELPEDIFGPEAEASGEPLEEELLIDDELTDSEAPMELSPNEPALDTVAREEILPKEEIPTKESAKVPELPPEISEVLGLLACLKQLTEELPEEDRDSYLQGRFPAVLESVIDSLKNLTIIGDTNGSGS
jgi:hypothetical protein